jgi:hypothetical protein
VIWIGDDKIILLVQLSAVRTTQRTQVVLVLRALS